MTVIFNSQRFPFYTARGILRISINILYEGTYRTVVAGVNIIKKGSFACVTRSCVYKRARGRHQRRLFVELTLDYMIKHSKRSPLSTAIYTGLKCEGNKNHKKAGFNTRDVICNIRIAIFEKKWLRIVDSANSMQCWLGV